MRGATMAVGYFLKLGALQGESRDSRHKGWIDLEAFSWGQMTQGAGRGGDIWATKLTDRTSMEIQDAWSSGRVFKTASIEVVKQATLRIDLLTVTVTSYQLAPTPAEAFSLWYQDVQVNHAPIKDNTQLASMLRAAGLAR